MTVSCVLEAPRSKHYLQSLRDAGTVGSAQRGETLCHEGQRSPYIVLIETGFIVAVKRTASGHQQNVAMYVPGDLVDHESFTLGASRCNAVALTAVTFHKIAHDRLQDLVDANAAYAAAFWHYVAFHGALAQEWLLSLGRRSAYARTAHLLCEIIYRTSASSTDQAITCPMPLTQTELADTLGLSVVHVNRTLMRLRQENLIHLRRGHIDVLDWPRFKNAAGFEPSYLQIRGRSW